MLSLWIFATLLAAPAPNLSSQWVEVAVDRAGSTGLVTVVISDENGNGLAGLTVEDLRVDDDGFPLEFTLLDRAATARATADFQSEVVIVLGPMDAPERTFALAQAADLRKRLQAHRGARVEVIDLGLAPTADLFQLRAPVEAALARLSDLVLPRKSLVYLVQHDRLGVDVFLAPRAVDADVALYPVLVRRLEVGSPFADVQTSFGNPDLASAISSDAGPSSDTYEELRFLDDIARSTGGVARLSGAKGLAGVVAGSRGIYMLRCSITAALADGGSHAITVSVRRSKLAVRALGRHLAAPGENWGG